MPPQNQTPNPVTPSSNKFLLPIVGGVILIIIIAFLAWYIFGGVKSAPSSTTATSTPAGGISISATTTTVLPARDFGGSATGTVTITPVLTPPSGEPALNRAWTPPASDPSLTPDVVASINANISATTAVLAKNPTDVDSWTMLAILRKDLDDYQGAAADFLYALKISPTDATVLGDLGDLYGNFLSNPQLGVTYYQKAIALDPSAGNLYGSLADLYRFKLGDTADAKLTLQKGITAKAAGYQDLQTTLNSMQ